MAKKDKNKFNGGSFSINTGSNNMRNGLHIAGAPNFASDIDLSDPSIPVIGYSPAVENELTEDKGNTITIKLEWLKPRNYNLLVALLVEGVTQGGVHLLDTASMSKIKGTVIAVDEAIADLPTMPENLKRIKEGDIVIFPPAAYQHVAEPGRDVSGVILLHINNVLAVLEMPLEDYIDSNGNVFYSPLEHGKITSIHRLNPPGTVASEFEATTDLGKLLYFSFNEADELIKFRNKYVPTNASYIPYSDPSQG